MISHLIDLKPDSWFFPLWKRQFANQLIQLWEQANLLGYPRFDNVDDFAQHIYLTCPDLINEHLN